MKTTPRCQQLIDDYCAGHCTHPAIVGRLRARFDSDALGGPAAWRCYAEAALTTDLEHYDRRARRATYCTRDEALRALLNTCSGSTGSSDARLAAGSSGGSAGGGGGSAVAAFAQALERCAHAPRCACLVHGTSTAAERLARRHGNVAFFFVLPTQAEADALAARFGLSGGASSSSSSSKSSVSNAYVLRADLRQRGASPLRNEAVNPRLSVLSSLQALQLSNEFFDLQLVHASAAAAAAASTSSAPALLAPTAAEARSLLSLAGWTLLALPRSTLTAWRAVLPSLGRAPSREEDAAAAAAELDVDVAAEDDEGWCAAGGGGDGGDDVCEGGSDDGADADGGCGAWGVGTGTAPPPPAGMEGAMWLRLRSLRRLNVHHMSCWDAPHCHKRMYVMDMSAEGAGANAEAGGWQRRVPRLFRLDEPPTGLAQAWARRGKPIPFETGGANLDTLTTLGLHTAQRAALAAQFLALPVGRDMMLWNIVAGARGAYAIDQEGVVHADGAEPWERRAMPYCLSVRDCYEKPLGRLCGLPYKPPGQLHGAALARCMATLFADRCPAPAAAGPYPCPNGCRPSYEDCVRGGAWGRAAAD